MTQNISLNIISGSFVYKNSDLSNHKDVEMIKKVTYYALKSPPELKDLHDDIITLTKEKRDFLIYQNDEKEEDIILSSGTLIGHLNGRYFCCWCYCPGCKLFFKEAQNLKDLTQVPDMKPERIKVLFQELDERLSQNPTAKYLKMQMQYVHDMWRFLHTVGGKNGTSNYYYQDKNLQMQTERQKAVNTQVAEAQSAKQRRLENEERNRQRKAAREAERLKRKKIAETTKRINAEAAKAAAERKAEEERIATMQKEAELKAKEEAIKEEMKRVTENMFQACDKHPNLPPVYDQDKDSNHCFYLKINNKVMHVVMSDTAPLCHQLSLEPRASTPLGVHDIQDIMTNINDHLNANGDFDELLCNFALFYQHCQEMITNKNTTGKNRTSTVSKNPKGVIVPKSTVRPLYSKVCHRLMRPSTFHFSSDNQR